MDDFIPVLYYALLVSHKEIIEGDFSDPYTVPEKVVQIQLTVHTYGGQPADELQVWKELNALGYYSRQYRLTSYWQPLLMDEPF